MAIQFFNTLTGRKEPFQPLEPGRVRMYHCGPTVYDYAHIGNFRSFLLADLLRRHLEYRGFAVTQVMNLTDVGHIRDDADEGEDKLEARARRERQDPWALAEHYIRAFFEDLDVMGVRRAQVYPRATEHIPDMIRQIERLLERGHAYVVEGAVYFDVSSFERYGALSGNTLESLRAGHRIDPHPDKRNPFDFALWKSDPHHLMKWESPWGPHGFPGWHIECSAMGMKYLGESFDIHTGGEDNKFPHHECEIAQAEGASGRPFVRTWLHVRHLLVDGEKMAKSKGNFYTIRDLVAKGYSGRAIRHAILSTHYRAPMNFTLDGLEAARRTLERIDVFRAALADPRPPGDTPEIEARIEAARAAFGAALDDDLGISPALAALHELIGELNKRALRAGDAARARAFLAEVDDVVGLFATPAQLRGAAEIGLTAGGTLRAAPDDAEVARLVAERVAARARREFARADAIRDELKARGVILEDRADGTRWRREG
ncbi:MAG: cysteine--tRNA ligase [Planctomycetes bacterium]|nr:cysteine--tRNA ligase [Planctomycetota bacterium]